MTPDARLADVAVVAIGRNEGERLRACLRSVVPLAACVVYVDSGSTDGSVEMARAMGVDVIVLDPAVPFTAALARNAGWRRVRAIAPSLDLVQFVDGDCTVVDGWMPLARAHLAAHPEVVGVCGRRRERHPDRSVYNLLCDLEWGTPVGEAKAFGGDAMVRLAALEAVGGYRADLICGEEPELCVRLRAAGGRIHRLDAEMTLHDAAMTRLSQWWKRTMRGGFAFAEGVALHGAPPERHKVAEARRAWAWGVALPLAVLLGALLVSPWALLGLLAYPLQMLRIFLGARGQPLRARVLRSFFLVLGRFAEAAGALKYHARRWSGGPTRLIEYK